MAISRKSIPKSVGIKERVKRVIDRLEKTHPDAKLDLNFSNPLELLIALILAAQARDDLVNKITVALFKKYRTAEDYARTTQPQLEKDIGKINFYRKKARAILSLAAGPRPPCLRCQEAEMPGLHDPVALPLSGQDDSLDICRKRDEHIMRSVIKQTVVLPAPANALFEMYLDPAEHKT